MNRRTVLVGTILAASIAVPVADALRIAPLRVRDAIVVSYRDRNHVAVVAQPDGRLLAIHSLRRVSPGTRVRVDGIKWGTPTAGIKWGTPAQGIKWGIKWGRNGSYQSPITPKKGTKKAVWTPVRGPIVKKFGRRAVAVGTPGAVVVVRVAPTKGSGGFSREQALPELPPVGATIAVRAFFGTKTIVVGRNLRYLKPPVPGASLPVAGRIESIDPVLRTIVIVDTHDPAYPVRISVVLPPEFSLTPYRVGQDVAVEGQLTSTGAIAATLIGPNGDFTQSDDENAVQISTAGEPSCPKGVSAGCPAVVPSTQTPIPGTGPIPPSSPSTSNPPPPPSRPGPSPTDPCVHIDDRGSGNSGTSGHRDDRRCRHHPAETSQDRS